METAAMGGRTGTHERLWTWQQHEEAVYRGPWQIRGLAAAMGGPDCGTHERLLAAA
ncbi:unnamed protein product [Staurois parvus]|uniref:Uncharacterized protein n=1 Tax=Staurois parvus TaxID=386267 RepID=A0ABN9FF38_9NEOB|nr:unnamed protein product [Staurois parvus]